MKSGLKFILQKLLGFDRYLYVFAIFKIKTLKNDVKEKDFFFFLNMLKPDSNVLDIGANIGIMTAHLSDNMPKGHIYSFEPIPYNFNVLQQIVNKLKNTNVSLYPFALGDEEKTIKMVLPIVDAVKMQGLSHVVHDSIIEFNEGEIIETECKTLDDTFPNTKIDGIKIDVENFEYFVLKGGAKLLQKYHPIIYIELWKNENREKCFELLNQLEYTIQVVQHNKLTLFDKQKHAQQNFIITHNAS